METQFGGFIPPRSSNHSELTSLYSNGNPNRTEVWAYNDQEIGASGSCEIKYEDGKLIHLSTDISTDNTNRRAEYKFETAFPEESGLEAVIRVDVTDSYPDENIKRHIVAKQYRLYDGQSFVVYSQIDASTKETCKVRTLLIPGEEAVEFMPLIGFDNNFIGVSSETFSPVQPNAAEQTEQVLPILAYSIPTKLLGILMNYNLIPDQSEYYLKPSKQFWENSIFREVNSSSN